MKKKEKIFNNSITLLVFLLFFLLFALISRWTPTAGDDWGYAVGGRYANVLVKAFENYMTWSGRFLSELWGFSIAPHKQIWNLFNPIIFTAILYYILKIVEFKTKQFHLLLLAVLLIVTVPAGLRMQTYTWIMGTTYVLPLLLFLIYIFYLKKLLFEVNYSIPILVVMGGLNLAIPLYMENIAAMLFISNVFICLYRYFTNKKFLSILLSYTLISLIGLLLIRFSPGAMFRMGRDHGDFNQLSLLGKISINWFHFLWHSFLNNQWLMRLLAIVSVIAQFLHIKSHKNGKKFFWIVALPMVVMFIRTYSWDLYYITNFNILYIVSDLNVPHSLLLNTIICFSFVFALFISVFTVFDFEMDKIFVIYIILCAGIANSVMLISPIFDSRSSIYTVYLLFIVCLALCKQIHLQRNVYMVSIALLIYFIANACFDYINLYRTVHQITVKRNQQIEYYRLRPDIKEAYFLGYPKLSIHSADIQETDDFHMEYFKKYYYLADDVKLHFYYLEDYAPKNIFSSNF